jgi:hypothetical protein
MAKDNKATQATETTTQQPEAPTPDMPAVTAKDNASRMGEMQKQMEAMKEEMAGTVAKEVVRVLQSSVKGSETSKQEEMPTPVSSYLTAKLASACFMALRDELVSAYMRCESVQADKAVLNERFAQDSFRSDVEKAAAQRSLDYYEQLDERLDEITNLIGDTVHVHELAAKAMFDEDTARQQDVPEAERTYVTVPSLRWVSSADKAAHPENWETLNDIERLKSQAKFWLNYNIA